MSIGWRSLQGQLLWRTQQPRQLLLALLGSLVGLALVLAASATVLDVRRLLRTGDRGAIGAQYVVLHKRVSLLGVLGSDRSALDAGDLAAIRAEPSIRRSAPFLANRFGASAVLEFGPRGGGNALRTDLFLESVDDAFLDVVGERWQWAPGDQTVPVILPADFMHLYNFTYAPARGLPQISRRTAQLFTFRIVIEAPTGPVTVRGRIAGFSDRITSMLVPQRFLVDANRRYGPPADEAPPIYRLIAEVDPLRLTAFRRFLEARGFETNEETLRTARFATLVQLALIVVAAFGVILVATAFSALLLYLQLAVQRSRQAVETLLLLGTSHREVQRWYVRGTGLLLGAVLGASLLLVWAVQRTIARALRDAGFDARSGLDPIVPLLGIGIIVVLAWLVARAVRRQLRTLALPSAPDGTLPR